MECVWHHQIGPRHRSSRDIIYTRPINRHSAGLARVGMGPARVPVSSPLMGL